MNPPSHNPAEERAKAKAPEQSHPRDAAATLHARIASITTALESSRADCDRQSQRIAGLLCELEATRKERDAIRADRNEYKRLFLFPNNRLHRKACHQQMTQAIAERDEARAKAGAMEARIAELEKEIAVFEKEQEAVAFRKSQADKCYHPDELVIGTEDGYICCHCWAEQAEAKLAEMMDKFRPENFIHHQATECGKCGIRKHTPWRDDTFGYVCATCLSEIHEADLTAARASALEYAAQVERMREALAGIIHWHGCTYSELAPLRSEEMGRARDSARSALSTPAATALIEFAEKVWKAGVMALRPYTSPSHLDAAWLSSPTYLALTKTGKEGV